MASYGSLIQAAQDYYVEGSEASADASEGLGLYRGEMREIESTSNMMNQVGDAVFSLYQGYQEGKQEHSDAAAAAKAAGFEYDEPDSLWETWKGVDEDAIYKSTKVGMEANENYGKVQSITGSELMNISDLYKAGGMKAVGDTSGYGTWRDTSTQGWSPDSRHTLGHVSAAGVEKGPLHDFFMKGKDKSSLKYQKDYYQENINQASKQVQSAHKKAFGEGNDNYTPMDAETTRDAVIDMYGKDTWRTWFKGRDAAEDALGIFGVEE